MSESVKMDEKVFDLTPVLTPISIFLSGLIVAGSILFTGSRGGFTSTTVTGTGSTSSAAAQLQTVEVKDVDFKGGEMIGGKDSNTVVVEYTDFQCPFCQRHYQQTFPSIKKDYIDNNKIAYYSKDFPLSEIHPDAQKAAEAANCAAEQGKFWEMHGLLFTNQSNLKDADLKKYAKDLTLNEAQFASCLDTSKMAQKVKDSASNGAEYGITGTPGFFVGVKTGEGKMRGFLIPGAYPFANFDTILKDIQTVGVDQAAKNFEVVVNS